MPTAGSLVFSIRVLVCFVLKPFGDDPRQRVPPPDISACSLTCIHLCLSVDPTLVPHFLIIPTRLPCGSDPPLHAQQEQEVDAIELSTVTDGRLVSPSIGSLPAGYTGEEKQGEEGEERGEAGPQANGGAASAAAAAEKEETPAGAVPVDEDGLDKVCRACRTNVHTDFRTPPPPFFFVGDPGARSYDCRAPLKILVFISLLLCGIRRLSCHCTPNESLFFFLRFFLPFLAPCAAVPRSSLRHAGAAGA